MSAVTDVNDAYPGITLLLDLEDEGWGELGLGDVPALIKRAMAATAAKVGLPTDLETEVGCTLADDIVLLALNERWRGKERPTNILSFPMRQLQPGELPGPLMGDMVLALETVTREAETEGKPLADHLSHLVVHGFLHLLGYDHMEDTDANAMERLEAEILSDLGVPDPYSIAAEDRRPGAPAPGL